MRYESKNGNNDRLWDQDELERWIVSREMGEFERFLEFRRAVARTADLQQELRTQIDAAWERGEEQPAIQELQRKDDVVSNVMYGMVVAKMLLMGQRTSERVVDDILEYAKGGSFLSDPDMVEAGLRSFHVERVPGPGEKPAQEE